MGGLGAIVFTGYLILVLLPEFLASALVTPLAMMAAGKRDRIQGVLIRWTLGFMGWTSYLVLHWLPILIAFRCLGWWLGLSLVSKRPHRSIWFALGLTVVDVMMDVLLIVLVSGEAGLTGKWLLP